MSDELDAKLARIGNRIQSRADAVREELKSIGLLELAEALRQTFGAKLIYLKTPRVEQGNPALMEPGCVWTVYEPPKVTR